MITPFVLGLLLGWGVTRFLWLRDQDRMRDEARRHMFATQTLYHPNNLREDSCADQNPPL